MMRLITAALILAIAGASGADLKEQQKKEKQEVTRQEDARSIRIHEGYVEITYHDDTVKRFEKGGAEYQYWTALKMELDEDMEELDQYVDELDDHMAELDVHMTRLDREMDQLDEYLDELDGQMDQLDDQMEDLDRKLDQLDEELEKLELELRRELVKDGLIGAGDRFRLKITEDELLLDGRPLSHELEQKHRALIESILSTEVEGSMEIEFDD